MRKPFLALVIFVISVKTSFAQSPQYIPYQAVARNAAGNLLVNQAVSLRFTIRETSGTGTIDYQESQSATTNNLGLFSVNIGNGNMVTGNFSNIPWSNGVAKYTQVEIDPTGGNSYTNMGAAQMMSVPYALFAGSATSVPSTNLSESTSDVLTISGGSNSVVSASGTSIQVKKASSSQDGYLSSADWGTFNGKQAALTFNSPLSNTSNIVTCGTCVTTTAGALTGNSPITVSAAGAISCSSCLTTGTVSGLANPSAAIGMTAINGSAITAMRSDAAPAINPAIAPVWTGTHTFSNSTYSALFSGGPVGIGTTSPVGALQVVTPDNSGGTLSAWNTGEVVIGKSGTTGGALGLSYDGTNSVGSIYSLAPSLAWKDLAIRANNTIFYSGGQGEGMRLTSGGNLGIGNPSPSYALDVKPGAGNPVALRVYGQYSSSSDNVQMRFAGQKDGETWAIGGDVASGGSTEDFEFYSLPNSATRMTILGAGNVGIGTTTPAGMLHVVTASSNDNVAAWGTGQLVVGQAGATGGGLGLSYSTSDNGGTGYISALSPSLSWEYLGYRASNHYFYVNGATEAMRINSSANVGIGGSPSQKLDVYGNGGFRGTILFENTPSLCPVNSGSHTLTSAEVANGVWYVQNNSFASLILPTSSAGQSQGQIMTIYNASTSTLGVTFPCVNAGCSGATGGANSIGSGAGGQYMWTNYTDNSNSGGWVPLW